MDHTRSPFKLKNAVSAQMPQYLVSNPNTLIRNELNQLDLSKNVNFAKNQPIYKPMVKINTNQKFGYSKDTPFNSQYIQYNSNTKAIFNQEQRILDQGQHQYFQTRSLTETQLSKVNGIKIFDKLSANCSAVENQKKVMLLYNKDAQKNIRENQALYLDKLAKQKQSQAYQKQNLLTQNLNSPSSNKLFNPADFTPSLNTAQMLNVSKQMDSDIQSQINSIARTNKSLKKVDKELLNFYWNVNTQRDNLSSSLINHIHEEKYSQSLVNPYTMSENFSTAKKPQLNSFIQSNAVIRNIELERQNTNSTNQNNINFNDEHLMTSNFGLKEVESNPYQFNNKRAQSAYSSHRKPIQASRLNNYSSNGTNYQEYQTTAPAKSASQKHRAYTPQRVQSSNGRNKNLQAPNMDKVMNEICYVASLGKYAHQNDMRPDAKVLMLHSYDHHRNQQIAEEQQKLSQNFGINQMQQIINTSRATSPTKLERNESNQKSSQSIIKKGEYNLAKINNGQQSQQQIINKKLAPITTPPTPMNNSSLLKQNSRPRSQYVNRNTSRIIQSEQKSQQNNTQKDFKKKSEFPGGQPESHYFSHQQQRKSKVGSANISKTDEYFNAKDNNPFNELNDEQRSQLTLSDKIQILNKGTPSKSRTNIIAQ
ncbi:UNKNOWN [Stylonychia lemnae]|uniref:Uncharacterized protein n=1 Tax=Stylonychia lemnae TaxID=5949 RepID=A0A077ZMU4_STYLE|nr:UNKNOWN [Stylonychia lemnae]|eukprot:CDW71287.1 UNKNOWN [Stylonychia lemnae]